MSGKITVGIVFGGKSAEHEVSLRSAKNVFDAIDRDKYDPVLIGIDKSGRWLLNRSERFPAGGAVSGGGAAALVPGSGSVYVANAGRDRPAENPNGAGSAGKRGCIVDLSASGAAGGELVLDVVFPILHGPFGEDGTVQGFLKLADLPFVGAGVLGSAVGMDKDVMKRLLRDGGIPIGRYRALRSHEKLPDFAALTEELGLPLFIKPANMGSSVGVSKVRTGEEFAAAVSGAFEYDAKIVIEEFIQGRELECSVLGNEDPAASLPGEIIPSHDFYSYEAKYLDEKGASLEIPAKLSPEKTGEVQRLAIQTFRTLCCEALARVDFFMKADGTILVNEINTMPGFTKISMYPKLWEASGLPYTRLIDKLIELALLRSEKEKKLKISFTL
ncbi:MAG: D-alanine--D-alanine ligase [Treponema sp.]|jgi:D-alanine-D-alanine ligase|nr:D-alanine--D-alanine ligase [Treponema sp.]